MKTNMDAMWVILAGGRAQRMGGKDKGLVKLNDIPLLEYVYQRLSHQNASIRINANRNQAIYQIYADTFADVLPDFVGPLGGMHAAMQTFEHEWYGFVPCDCPNLPPNLLEKMYKTITPTSEILVAHDGEAIQPVVTMIKKTVFTRLDNFLQNGDRKIVLLYDQCHTQYVDFSDEHDAFINLNTPEELEKYGALA